MEESFTFIVFFFISTTLLKNIAKALFLDLLTLSNIKESVWKKVIPKILSKQDIWKVKDEKC